MDTDNLKRAWEYGLRLLVVHAVNSTFLCQVTEIPSNCPDQPAIEEQLQAAWDLQNEIDTDSGGPGKGWYRIVLTPQEARKAILDGKLAVVLGVETSNAFAGCVIVSGGTTPAVPKVVNFPPNPPETKWRQNCGGGALSPLLKDGTTARAVALMERYRKLGARHFYAIHNLPGIAGGNSLSAPIMHAMNNPSRRAPGSPFDKVADIDRVMTEVRLPVNSFSCSSTFSFDGGRCNTQGLTFTGLNLVRMMASYGSIIDFDHLSFKSKHALWGDGGLGKQYPVVSSHSGFNAINGGDKSNEDQLTPADLADVIKWDGALAPILLQGTGAGDVATFPAGSSVAPNTCPGTTETWIQAYRYAVNRLKSTPLATGKPAFVGVGFGSDFNGLAGWPRPRFDGAGVVYGEFAFDAAFVGGNRTPVGGRCYLAIGGFPSNAPPHVTYPFTSPMTNASFDKSVLAWSGRNEPYDVSYDGVAHVGMIPDFVEEMRTLGLTDEELEPLWSGAEKYIRTWESGLSWADSYSREKQKGIQVQCQQTRAELAVFGNSTEDTVNKWKNALGQLRTLGCDATEDAP